MRPMPPRDRERGSATVWMVAVMAMIWAMTMAVVLVGAARVARHRAENAADLSALAAAARAFSAPRDACARAETVAAANGARVDFCSVVGGTVSVSVSVRFGFHTASATARAGPVTAEI
ncbi:flp pilus-assembly TadE/G-like family protein [Planotetraspora sp. A-T 1434]|uniref:Rv3654c family TadE-like protein n=1 Tax=Planotetraspora sp. A-T 1434 TaxID=2979219 RepID=UPI0021C2121E|nr:Rv3654c family TadE-like protein [Planotetraspora sp. A-T 1434]MCT9932490.1 flp pilus-assembly TadE/G-like family protein [Planotetraspora sp. A-T 1434]